jgi:hypothetical protein
VRTERARERFWQGLSRAEIVQDMEYLMELLENNFPLLDALYLVQGIDKRAHGEAAIAMLRDESFTIPDNPDDFINWLNAEFLQKEGKWGNLEAFTRSSLILATHPPIERVMGYHHTTLSSGQS